MVCRVLADGPEAAADADIPAGTPPAMVCHILRAAVDKSLKPEHLHSRADMPGKELLGHWVFFFLLLCSVSSAKQCGLCLSVQTENASLSQPLGP
jgi:hypothetical protein